MLTFQKDYVDGIDGILFGLYSNPLTRAAQLLFAPLDKGKNLRTGRLCKFLKVTVSLTIGSPSFCPKLFLPPLISLLNKSSLISFLIALRGGRGDGLENPISVKTRLGKSPAPSEGGSLVFSVPFHVSLLCPQTVKLVGPSMKKENVKGIVCVIKQLFWLSCFFPSTVIVACVCVCVCVCECMIGVVIIYSCLSPNQSSYLSLNFPLEGFKKCMHAMFITLPCLLQMIVYHF